MSTVTHRRNKHTGLIICIAVVCIVMACLITYWLTNDTPECEPIVNGHIQHTTPVKACFIRNEDILSAPSTGYLISDLTEGETAGANQILFSTVSQDSYPLVDSIKQLDSEIFTALISSDVNKKLFTEKDAILNNSIIESLNNIISSVSLGSYSSLGIYVGNVNDALNDKYDTYVKFGDTSVGEVANLISRRDSYKTSLAAHTNNVKLATACSISYNIYNNSKICEFDEISRLQASYLDKFTAELTTTSLDTIYAAGTNVVRAVYGHDYYIAFSLTEEQYADIYYLNDYSIKLSNGTIIPCEMVKIIDCRADSGKYTVILTTGYGMDDTIGLMYDQNAELIFKDYEGFKVRRSSIFDYNSTTGEGYIYILSKIGAAEKRMVKVLTQDTYFAIIEEIPNKYDDSIVLYDEIIINPSSVMEGQLIR